VGRLERFLRLERPRPDRKDASGSATLDRFRDPPQGKPDADGAEAAARGPRSCAECGAENNASAARCFNCDADLETPEMRLHQKRERLRAAREAEQRKRENEELAQREFERLRRESEARREQPAPMPGSELPPFAARGSSPLLWLLQWLNAIEDPWYRLAARLGVIAAFIGLVIYALGSPARYPLFLLAALLLGGLGPRRRRWDRWDRWGR
jgi:hypothetical protein